jgi:chaperone modulatory protein CbpM
MISESELIAAIGRLEVRVLHEWIEMGLLAPHRDAGGYLFDDADIARVNLVCDLSFDMGVGEESLPVILHLIDQLHGTRHTLKALTAALAEQPEEIRVTITTRARHVLRGTGSE